MKKNKWIKFAGTLLVSCTILLASCHKEKKAEQGTFESEMLNEEPSIRLSTSGYTSEIETPLEKESNYDYYTKGVIKYTKDGKDLGKFDFGDGKKDSWGKKIIDGKSNDVDLTHKKKESKFDKKIIMPLVKTDDCKYIVEGIIKYYKNGKWIATIDFGDGTCDDIATKTWEGGSKEFNLSYLWKKK